MSRSSSIVPGALDQKRVLNQSGHDVAPVRPAGRQAPQALQEFSGVIQPALRLMSIRCALCQSRKSITITTAGTAAFAAAAFRQQALAPCDGSMISHIYIHIHIL